MQGQDLRQRLSEILQQMEAVGNVDSGGRTSGGPFGLGR